MRKPSHIATALAVATFALFSPSLTHEFVNYDDTIFVTENKVVQSGLSWGNVVWAFTEAPYSCPLAWVSHMTDVSLFGAWAGGHHLVNVLFHVANVALLFHVLRRMTGALWPSAIVAALFGWHPLHVESVAWIAERRDVLSTFFWLLMMLAYLRYTQAPGWRRHVPVFVWMLLGLLSKAMLVTAPFVLLLLDFWPLGRMKDALAVNPAAARRVAVAARVLQLALEKTPLFLLTAFFTLEGFYTAQMTGLLSRTEGLPLTFRLSNALAGYVKYLAMTLWPAGLSPMYPLPDHYPTWQTLGAAGFLALVTVWTIRAWKERPHLLVGWLWYLGTLVPVIGLVQGGMQSIADRYTYVPLIGLFIAAVWEVKLRFERWPMGKRALAWATGVTLVACAVAAELQLLHWRDRFHLFSHALRVNPANALALNNLGAAFNDTGQPERALHHLLEAYKLEPASLDVNYNLGSTLHLVGRHAEARKHYAFALARQPDTDLVAAALSRFEAAATANASDAEAWLHLGNALRAVGRAADAATAFNQGLRHRPGHPSLLVELGATLCESEQSADAMPHLEAATRESPTNVLARAWLAGALLASGRLGDARREAEVAVRLAPQDPAARASLAAVLRAGGHHAEAARELAEALRGSPDDPLVLARLASLLAAAAPPQLRDSRQAVQLAERACQRSGWKRAACVAAYADALRASQRFAEAAEFSHRAATLADTAGQPQLATRIRMSAEMSRGKQP